MEDDPESHKFVTEPAFHHINATPEECQDICYEYILIIEELE